MADQCLTACCPAIDCQLLRDFLAGLRPLSMAAVVLSFTCKVAGKRTKLILVTWVEEKNKTIQSFFYQKNILSRFLHWLQVVLPCLHSAVWFLAGGTSRTKAARAVWFHHGDEHPHQRSPASFSVEPHMALLGSRRISTLYFIGPLQRSHQHLTGDRNFSSTERS